MDADNQDIILRIAQTSRNQEPLLEDKEIHKDKAHTGEISEIRKGKGRWIRAIEGDNEPLDEEEIKAQVMMLRQAVTELPDNIREEVQSRIATEGF